MDTCACYDIPETERYFGSVGAGCISHRMDAAIAQAISNTYADFNGSINFSYGNDILNGLSYTQYVKIPVCCLKKVTYTFTDGTTVDVNAPIANVLEEKYIAKPEDMVVGVKGKWYIGEKEVKSVLSPALSYVEFMKFLLANFNAAIPFDKSDVTSIWYYCSRISAFVNGFLDGVGTSEYNIVADPADPDNGVKVKINEILAVYKEYSNNIVDLAITAVCNFWVSNHNNGSGSISNFSKSMYNVSKFKNLSSFTDKALGELFYKCTHFFSRTNVMYALCPTKCNATVPKFLHIPKILAGTTQALYRINALPASTHRIGLAIAITEELKKMGIVHLLVDHKDYKIVTDHYKRIIEDSVRYHPAKFYFLYPEKNIEDDKNLKFDEANRIINKGAYFLHLVNSESTLMMSKIVETAVNNTSTVDIFFLRALKNAIEGKVKDQISTELPKVIEAFKFGALNAEYLKKNESAFNSN